MEPIVMSEPESKPAEDWWQKRADTPWGRNARKSEVAIAAYEAGEAKGKDEYEIALANVKGRLGRIDTIERLTTERDAALAEVERLRGSAESLVAKWRRFAESHPDGWDEVMRSKPIAEMILAMAWELRAALRETGE